MTDQAVANSNQVISKEQADQILNNLKTVMNNNNFGEKEVQLMVFGILCALGDSAPPAWQICALAGRPIIDVPKRPAEPYVTPGVYTLIDEYDEPTSIEVDFGEDARDVALYTLGYTLSQRPTLAEEEEE